jgi:hypothetical protein
VCLGNKAITKREGLPVVKRYKTIQNLPVDRDEGN